MEETLKKCCKCKTEKPLGCYYKVYSGKYGVDDKCKECAKRHQKEIYNRNKQKIILRTKTWISANKKRVREYQKLWRTKHKNKKREYMLKYWVINTEKHYFASVKYYGNKKSNGGIIPQDQIEKLLKESNNICFWCNKDIPKGKLHVDHLYPLSKGGKHEISNIVVSCQRCNLSKNNKSPEIFMEEILIDW